MWEKKPQAPAEMQELPVRCKENTFFFFFTMGVVEHWNWLPRLFIESASLEIFKAQWDVSEGYPTLSIG